MIRPTADIAQQPDTSAERQESVKFVIRRAGVIGLGHMGHALAVNLVEDVITWSSMTETRSG